MASSTGPELKAVTPLDGPTRNAFQLHCCRHAPTCLRRALWSVIRWFRYCRAITPNEKVAHPVALVFVIVGARRPRPEAAGASLLLYVFQPASN